MRFYRIEKFLNYRKEIEFIVLMCIASHFFAKQISQKVIDAIAIPVFFRKVQYWL